MVVLLFLILVVLPLVWLASEFQHRQWLRILLGSLSLVSIGFCAYQLGQVLATINANAYFAGPNKALIERIISDLEGGREEQLLVELESLNARYQPSYETRSDLDTLVERFIANMESKAFLPDSEP